MKNREELQNSIFEKSLAIIKRRRQIKIRTGAALLCLTAAAGIFFVRNLFDKKQLSNNPQTGMWSAEKETGSKQTDSNNLQTEQKYEKGNYEKDANQEDNTQENNTGGNIVLVSETAEKIAERTNLSEKFIQHTADFSIELFQKSFQEKQKENVMISPLSAMLVLSMAANGADKETLSEMEMVLGGELGIEEINQNLNSLMTGLYNGEKTKLFAADSIWVRNDENDFIVSQEFLEKNKKYYYADAFAKPFNQETIQEMNQWISEKTNGMFQNIIEQLSPSAKMYLFNTMIFEAEWRDVYYQNQIGEGFFTNYNGKAKKTPMMYSTESLYLNTENAQGFLKPYENGYSFAALLPDEGIDIGEFIQSLNGETFLKIMEETENGDTGEIYAALPKFSSKTCVRMEQLLQTMGIKKAFQTEEADFSKIDEMSRSQLFFSEVIQNSYINVDETGTQAGAVTQAAVSGKGVIEQREIVLNRPFVYAVIDNQTKLPIYIGAVLNIEE